MLYKVYSRTSPQQAGPTPNWFVPQRQEEVNSASGCRLCVLSWIYMSQPTSFTKRQFMKVLPWLIAQTSSCFVAMFGLRIILGPSGVLVISILCLTRLLSCSGGDPKLGEYLQQLLPFLRGYEKLVRTVIMSWYYWICCTFLICMCEQKDV